MFKALFKAMALHDAHAQNFPGALASAAASHHFPSPNGAN
jgi:hypothetical protein